MSGEGDRTCPLCTEEMDPTDQQLKPCKCGYEICVWCWHHIMEMAEKDETEGRCPACRTPYNKEKIVGMAATCERLVSDMNTEKKPKSQKGKSKTPEGRKQHGSVRVIQRNLVYVVGLPSNLAVEDILQRREYFGQYGKVLKVSISRPTNGSIQQFGNSTCSVYITYSKEEEAVRCIQFVHGFLLEGKPLRACFGTTKYCHAWLRNVPCSNPDCLYLHEIGSQEDSFTKDEIISSYTRNRVQQITGSSYITQRHSGTVLPPPTDDNSATSSAFPGKPASKTAANNHSFDGARLSPPSNSPGGSAAHLTAPSWGGRPSSNQPLLTSTACLGGPPSHQKPNMHDSQSAFPKAVLSAGQASQLQNDTGKRVVPDEESSISSDKPDTGKRVVPDEESSISWDKTTAETSEPVNSQPSADGKIGVSDISVASAPLHHVSLSIQPTIPPTTILPSATPNNTPMPFSEILSDKDFIDDNQRNIDNACSAILSTSIHENQKPHNIEQVNPLICQASGKAVNMTEVHSHTVPSDFISGLQIQLSQVHLQQQEEDSFSFGNVWLEDTQVAINRVPDDSCTSNLAKYSNILSPLPNNDGIFSTNFGKRGVDSSNLIASTSDFSSGHHDNILDSREFDDAIYSELSPSKEARSRKEARSQLGSYERKVCSTSDIGESSIISNMLSMDFDPWNESTISPWSLFGETEKRQGFSEVQGSRKTPNSCQSRFAFAREDDPNVQVSYFGQSSGQYEDILKDRPFVHNFSDINNMQVGKFVHRSNLPSLSGTEPDTLTSSHSYISSNKLSALRSQIPAPPGFSVPNRPPPPGFSTLEKIEHIFESASGNHITDASSSLRNQYQAYSSGSIYSNGEVEFDDPAILAVGKGTFAHSVHSPGIDMRYSLPPPSSSYEDSRVQLVPQRSLPPYQSQKLTDMSDNFSSLGEAYGSHSRILEQKLSNNFSQFPQFSLPQSRNGLTANVLWNGWNEAQSATNVGVAELLRTERLGLNRFYSGYEDPTMQMPSSGNLYNGTYGI